MKRIFFPFALLASALFCLAGPAYSQTLTILHNFGDGSVANDGSNPTTGLIQVPEGNLYGTTAGGGSGPGGTAFEMTPSGQITILHSFDDGSVVDDGVNPGPLTLASDSAFYGTTSEGGSDERGTVFHMTPAGQVTILHSFDDGSVVDDGVMPEGTLVDESNGTLLGLTWLGGSADSGTIYEVSGGGTVTILHSFGDGTVANDGLQPSSGLVKGPDGDYYGETEYGGSTVTSSGENGFGTLFETTPSGHITIVHNFGDGSVANDGEYPIGGLVVGNDGNFYGTTFDGGSAGVGAVFEMSPSGQVTILHSFADGSVSDDGMRPRSTLVLGTDGNLYGTTSEGGSASQGTVFEITPAGHLTVLHSFDYADPGYDGSLPVAGVVEGKDGSFYGTTSMGGSFDLGTVYKLTPAAMLNINPLAVAGGKTITATLNVYSPVAAKTLVRLSSSDPSAATVKQTIYISAGHSTVTFNIQTVPLAANENVTITAQLPTAIVSSGSVSGTFAISAPQLTSVQLDESSVPGGGWVNGTINLSSAAPAGGETVALSSVNNSYGAVTGFLSSPPGTDGSTAITSLTVPAGATSAQFVSQTKAVPKTASVTVRGTLDGTSRGAALAVTPPPAT